LERHPFTGDRFWGDDSMPTDEIMVEKVFTEDELYDLFVFSIIEDEATDKPDPFPDNTGAWATWLYKNGYRLVKVSI